MRTFTKLTLSACIGLVVGMGQAWAGAKPDQVNRLQEDLTPMGSERAGNADGTIPEWTGGITSPPAGYSPGDHHPSPWPEDKPLFRIDGSNYQQYADKLSVGQQATFAKYPDTYYMDVYQSRRSTSFPEHIYEMTAKNAATAKLAENGEGVLDAAEGFPFPFPENAYELMWNQAQVQGCWRYAIQHADRPNSQRLLFGDSHPRGIAGPVLQARRDHRRHQ